MRLKDKVAVITGSSRGIGRAAALRFAEEGCRVVVVARNYDPAQEVTEAIQEKGGQAVTVMADVSKKVDVEKLFKTAVENFGRLDILVASAGITKGQKLTDITEEDWQSIIDVNLKGTFLSCQEAFKYMIPQKYGKVVTLSSVYAWGSKGQLHYDATKGGIVSMTRSMALEMAKHNIHINCVAPGLIDTEMPKVIPEKIVQEYILSVPFRRLGTAEEVANTILFLVSDQSDFITGQVIHINGGVLRA